MSKEHNDDNLTDQLGRVATELKSGNVVPGTGQNICRTCLGKGLYQDQPCPECGGSGQVVDGMGAGGV